MPGGKQSKTALFEEINFSIYNDGDRTSAYMTNKEGLPLWMKCIDEHYKSLAVYIEWSKCDYQAKMMAQIQEHAANPHGAANKKTEKVGNLTIYFYLTTYRILIQENQCGKWCREVFPCIKASVEKARQAGGSSDSNETIDDLLAELNASNSFDEEDTGDNPTTHAAVETNLQRQQPSPQPSRRRSLPSTPPLPGHHDHRVFESLKSSVEKVIEENITIKETLHSVTLKLQDFDHVHARMESLTAELNKSKNEVENCQEIIKSE